MTHFFADISLPIFGGDSNATTTKETFPWRTYLQEQRDDSQLVCSGFLTAFGLQNQTLSRLFRHDFSGLRCG